MFDSLIVSCLREMVESDGECVGGQVGCEIRLGLEDLAQQSARIVSTARQMLTQQRGQAGLGAISNHLERIDEVLPLGA